MSAPRTCRLCGEADPALMKRDASKPGGLDTICTACQRASGAAYRAANREKERARVAAYRAANREKVRARDAAYRAANREKVRAREAAYRAANPEKARARNAAYRAANREKERARNAAAAAAYAARSDEQIAATRARLRPDGVKRCRGCREALSFEAFCVSRANPDGLQNRCTACGGTSFYAAAVPYWHRVGIDPLRCVYCGGEASHADHVVPKALGGDDHPSNLVPACVTCNSSKSARPVGDFLATRTIIPYTDALWMHTGTAAMPLDDWATDSRA